MLYVRRAEVSGFLIFGRSPGKENKLNQLTQQTMTIKELAEVAGCSTKTVRRTIADKYPGLTKNGKVAKLTKEQCFDIMSKLPKKNDLGQNLGQMSKVDQGLKKEVSELKQSVNGLISVMSRFIESQIPQPKQEQLQIAPKLEPKDEIRKIINSYTAFTASQYRDNWNLLYTECYYRLGKNFRVLAQNRQMKPMDIIVSEGFAPDVLLVARDIFQLGRS